MYVGLQKATESLEIIYSLVVGTRITFSYSKFLYLLMTEVLRLEKCHFIWNAERCDTWITVIQKDH